MSEELNSAITEEARAIVRAYYVGTPEELDAAAERLRTLLGWDASTTPTLARACPVVSNTSGSARPRSAASVSTLVIDVWRSP